MVIPSGSTLAPLRLPEQFYEIKVQKTTGTVRVEKDGTVKVLYFAAGNLAYASSTSESDRLGEVLIRADKLTREELDMATSKLEAGKTLGKQLIDLGFVTPENLLMGAKKQVEDIVTSLFRWPGASLEWVEGPLPEGVVNLKISTESLTLKGLFQIDDRESVMQELGGEAAIYNFTPDFMERYEKLKLPESVDTIIAGIDGSRNVGALAKLGKDGEFQSCQTLVFCKAFGLIVSQPPMPSPEVKESLEAPTVVADPPPPLPPEPSPLETPLSHETEDESSALNLNLSMPASPEPGETPVSDEEVPLQDPAGTIFNANIPDDDRPKTSIWPKILISAGAILVLSVIGLGVNYWWKLRNASEDYTPIATATPRDKAVFFDGPEGLKENPLTQEDSEALPTESGASDPEPQVLTLPDPDTITSANDTTESTPSEKTSPAKVVESQKPVAAPPPDDPKPTPSAKSQKTAASNISAPEARTAIKAGDYAKAAKHFRSSLKPVSGSYYSVQLELVCVEKSILKSYEASNNSHKWFFVPTTFQGRSCYRIAWGVFKSRTEAEKARSHLPSYYSGQNHRPQLVKISNLK